MRPRPLRDPTRAGLARRRSRGSHARRRDAPRRVLRPSPSPPTPSGRSGSEPPLRDDGDPASLRAAVEQSLRWLASQPADRVLVAGPRRVTVAEQARALQGLVGVPGGITHAGSTGGVRSRRLRDPGERGRDGRPHAGDRILRAGRRGLPRAEPRVRGAHPRTPRRPDRGAGSMRSIRATAESACSAGSRAGGWCRTGGGRRSTRAGWPVAASSSRGRATRSTCSSWRSRGAEHSASRTAGSSGSATRAPTAGRTGRSADC